jgi:hypothetical protein
MAPGQQSQVAGSFSAPVSDPPSITASIYTQRQPPAAAVPMAAGEPTTTSYAGESAWRRQMAFLPPELHWAEPDNPGSVGLQEATFPWRGHSVHMDRFDVAESPVQLILLHGG